jgi:hypothetical protein
LPHYKEDFMSIATEITRLQGLRNTIRAKLLALGLISDSAADLSDCIGAVDGLTNNAAVSATLDISAQEYTVPQGYHNGAGKISIIPEEKTATPGGAAQEITPSTGKVLSKVTIAAIPGNMADVSGVTAEAADVLANKIIVTASKQQVAGTMINNGAVGATINGTTVSSYTVPAGYHNGGGTVSLDGTIEAALAAI